MCQVLTREVDEGIVVNTGVFLRPWRRDEEMWVRAGLPQGRTNQQVPSHGKPRSKSLWEALPFSRARFSSGVFCEHSPGKDSTTAYLTPINVAVFHRLVRRARLLCNIQLLCIMHERCYICVCRMSAPLSYQKLQHSSAIQISGLQGSRSSKILPCEVIGQFKQRDATPNSQALSCKRGKGPYACTRSPPAKANRAQYPAGSPDFRKRESCWTMPLVGGSSRGSLASPAPSFRRHSIVTSIILIRSQYLAVKGHPNLLTHPSHVCLLLGTRVCRKCHRQFGKIARDDSRFWSETLQVSQLQASPARWAPAKSRAYCPAEHTCKQKLHTSTGAQLGHQPIALARKKALFALALASDLVQHRSPDIGECNTMSGAFCHRSIRPRRRLEMRECPTVANSRLISVYGYIKQNGLYVSNSHQHRATGKAAICVDARFWNCTAATMI
ncbi:hypothetical protein PR048_030964 [Dryococelus australis]|uniref:Uncharacterized protein n=1 Tax=Dryococelus australis TaxID=614101 RepID=A0ABQ9GAU1_9NEOP|nr:hypothetical protein PR048_030964 [Dryococelus australis]